VHYNFFMAAAAKHAASFHLSPQALACWPDWRKRWDGHALPCTLTFGHERATELTALTAEPRRIDFTVFRWSINPGLALAQFLADTTIREDFYPQRMVDR
jgi:hypothetical protein